ncbi:MAG TPA: hypothetical protein VMR41_01470 [Patescibacteria group bacterium]|nr:hypothetical protein [Patescibacteria group bacterium]
MRRLIYFLSLLLFFICLLAAWQYVTFYDNKLHIVFCNVGQGDGIFIKTPNNKVILIDAGPDKSILSCLSSRMPFWDHTIDFMVLAHPYIDDYGGMQCVIDRYNITYFFSENLRPKDSNYLNFVKQLKSNNIDEIDVLAGSAVTFKNGLKLTFIGPSKNYLAASQEQACVVSLLTYGSFKALFTCDSQVEGLEDAFKYWSPEHINLLQVPQHGSKTGLDGQILDLLSPQLSVISVGKNNFDQPNPQTLQLLKEKGIKVLETINNGDVEIVN